MVVLDRTYGARYLVTVPSKPNQSRSLRTSTGWRLSTTPSDGCQQPATGLAFGCARQRAGASACPRTGRRHA
jgi:hypothetical protein